MIQFAFPPRPEIRDPSTFTSQLGNEIFSSLVFKKVEIIEDATVSQEDAEQLIELELQDVILSVSKQKNVVETPVQGRPGSVKEYISDGDYRLLVRGVLATPYRSVSPKVLAESLEAHLSLGQTLEIAGTFLESFSIHTVVVNDFAISEVAGTRNIYDIRISMTEDTPIELIIEDSEL